MKISGILLVVVLNMIMTKLLLLLTIGYVIIVQSKTEDNFPNEDEYGYLDRKKEVNSILLDPLQRSFEFDENGMKTFTHNVCLNVHCGAGRVCQVDDSMEPQCMCVDKCPEETESRQKACSNHNETWTSACAVYQHRCWCDTADIRCKSEKYKHVHIDYYGECRQMPACKEEEMADFPRRMREWLFSIMRDLADRDKLSEYYIEMEREAELNLTKRWLNAAIWKWCDLDDHPFDRSISRHELFPIRAPLVVLEHCIAPFLDSCDVNNDHRIALNEWIACLELNENELDQECEKIHKDV